MNKHNMDKTCFSINDKDSGQRLDIFLAAYFNVSRAQAQKTIKEKLVTINNRTQNAHYILKSGDKIKIMPAVKSANSMPTKYELPKLKIINETKDYVVIDKPAGLIVHGGSGIMEPTLTDVLEQQYSDIKKVGDDPMRPGIVHRLDKEASGVMVVAKNNQTFEYLKNQFQKRHIYKNYIALVYGAINKDHDEISFPISRSAKGYKMAAHAANQDGRRALTEFQIKQAFINYTLLDVKIKTGRTHQIRVHLSAYGHPIVGDELYGTRKTKEQNKKLDLQRLFLHAWQLGFTDLQGEEQIFESELPDELQKFLQNIYGK